MVLFRGFIMKTIRQIPNLLFFLTMAACVTINVYFPAAAAESAADKIINEIYGNDKDTEQTETPKEPETEADNSSILDSAAIAVMNFFIPTAHAQQADINISSPAINKIKSQMKARHKTLTPFYTSGAVGMEDNGFITIKDIKAVSLDKRNVAKKLVSDDNRDRKNLYAEIARANGHPEWEAEIKSTFARRWIANAPGGWWYKSGGSWKQK